MADSGEDEDEDEDEELPVAEASREEAETDVHRRQSNRQASTRESGQGPVYCSPHPL